MTPVVVVVGGGYGGATVAKALDDVADVILVEPRDAFGHNVAALRAVVDPNWADRMFLPYGGLLARGRVVRDRAERVEPGLVVLGSGERLAADYIVLATGSTYPFPAKIDTADTADARARMGLIHGALEESAAVLLLGAGPVGLEFAGEIRAAWPEKRITVVDPSDHILRGDVPDELRDEVWRQLTALHVELLLGTSLVEEPSSPPGSHKPFTAALTSGGEVSADIWFRCHGARPVTDYLGGSLVAARQPDGLLAVESTLQLVGQTAVFALGDITATPEAKKAKAAEDHAVVIAGNIRALIEGTAELTAYQPGGFMMALSLGPTGGAAYTPKTGVLGADATARAKSADLRTEFYEGLLGLS